MLPGLELLLPGRPARTQSLAIPTTPSRLRAHLSRARKYLFAAPSCSSLVAIRLRISLAHEYITLQAVWIAVGCSWCTLLLLV
jgi:hypothetical protein